MSSIGHTGLDSDNFENEARATGAINMNNKLPEDQELEEGDQ